MIKFWRGILCLSICLALPAGCLAQSHGTSKQENSLKRFLRAYLKIPNVADNGETTEFFPAFVDLKDDGIKEVIVYLTGRSWCGSGGCSTLILVPKGSSYKVITRILITHPPIRVLTTKSNGWHDIAVQVGGGGILHAYEAKLSFNGKTYPINPSIPPARRLGRMVAGEVVVSSIAKAKSLYR